MTDDHGGTTGGIRSRDSWQRAGAKLLAWTFAARGQRVAAIERKYVGGACPNIACLPSKNIIHTAQVAHYVRNSEEFGIAIEGFSVKMESVRERKRGMVRGLVYTHLDLYRRSGAELIVGSGRFVGLRTVEAMLPDGTKRLLRGTNVVIGTGSRRLSMTLPDCWRQSPSRTWKPWNSTSYPNI